MKRTIVAALTLAVALTGGRAEAAIRITEWMYTGDDGEFAEFTNIGGAPIDLTGWSFSDSTRMAGQVSLSSLGVIAAGESFLVTELPAATFRAAWNLSNTIKIIGENVANLGRSDEINIYDASNALVDRLTYGDQVIAGSIRTQGRSGIPSSLAALGANNVLLWQLATAGDAFGSQATGTAANNVGNPGRFSLVPEPATLSLAALGGLAIAALRRKSSRFSNRLEG